MIQAFKAYRLKKGYSENTLKIQNHHIKTFLNWCINKNITHENITYNEVLKFIDNERSRNIASASITGTINSIKIYFDYLIERGDIQHNVIRQIKIRNQSRKALPELLTIQQLEEIYKNFSNVPNWKHKTTKEKLLHERNTVLLGLLIYQGLESGEIARLETIHVNLIEGKIYVPSRKKSNARTLKLQALQIIPLKTYLEETRPQLLEKLNNQTTYLFASKKYSDMICRIVKQAKRTNPVLKDSRQIRTSVIMNWLKTNNIRQVQYMTGHKKIKSTESYKNQDLTDLTRQLEKYHPMK